MIGFMLSVMMIAAIALSIGAIVLFRRGLRKQPLLMLVLVLILAINITIWTLPNPRGVAPATADLDQ